MRACQRLLFERRASKMSAMHIQSRLLIILFSALTLCVLLATALMLSCLHCIVMYTCLLTQCHRTLIGDHNISALPHTRTQHTGSSGSSSSNANYVPTEHDIWAVAEPSTTTANKFIHCIDRYTFTYLTHHVRDRLCSNCNNAAALRCATVWIACDASSSSSEDVACAP
jgi:hypothetical protein